ncbi:MAG: Response regulator [Acidobacteriota bacterium]|nr:Response regulator [Acidobacteriota bacterium]
MLTLQNKKYSFSISRKVWLSLSIMVFGYLASMIVGFFLGINSESRLQRVSESVFPAAMQSQVALAEFKEQVQYYHNAVMTGEESSLTEARSRAARSQKAFKNLFTFINYDEAKTKNLQQLLRELTDFTTAADSRCSRLLSNIENEDPNEAELMQSRTQELQEKLTNLTNTFSSNLKSELVNVGNATRNQRYWNIVVFIFAVSLSLFLVKIIIDRLVTQPLQKAADLATAMAEGDLSRKLDIRHQQDEIGELARAMNVMAEKIESSHTELEQKVTDRTASLEETNQRLRAEITERKRTEEILKNTQEKLVESARLAEEANKSKSEFLANMSHEIRTPLTGVIGMIEMLAHTPLTPEQRDFVDTIAVSGETLYAIINDILDISKIEAGEFSLASEPFDLKKTLENIIHIFAPQAEKKGLDFRLYFNFTHSCYVWGDEVRVRQIIYNLVGNALKFTDKGKIEIRVNTGEIIENIMKFQIDVEDTGIGIKQEFLENIFQKFTQADASDTRKHGGTGLGLYITRQLVEVMGGSIDVATTPGKGSTFHIILPLQLEDQPVVDTPAMVKKPAQGTPPLVDKLPEKPLIILLAEDHPINQKLITAMIKTTGHKMDIVNNGKAAVEKVIGDSYDLVLMDIQMPEMNGLDATRAIRNAGFEKLPIIAMTASAFKKDRDMCLEAGMSDYIAKPLKKDVLLEMIAKWGYNWENRIS